MSQKSLDNVYSVVSGGGPVDQGLYEESSTQKFELGYTLRLADGRTFKYMKNSSTALTVAGTLLQSKANAHAAAKVQDLAPVASKPFAVDDTTVYFTATAALSSVLEGAATTVLSANRLKDGFLFVCDSAGTGYGQQYKIKGNSAGATTTGSITVTLWDPIRVAATTTTLATAIGVSMSLYRDVIIHPTTATGLPVGVNPIAVTASYYFWGQTYGPCVIHTEGVDPGDSISAGQILIPSTSTAGCVMEGYFAGAHAAASNTYVILNAPPVAMAMGALVSGSDKHYIPAFLQIAA